MFLCKIKKKMIIVKQPFAGLNTQHLWSLEQWLGTTHLMVVWFDPCTSLPLTDDDCLMSFNAKFLIGERLKGT